MKKAYSLAEILMTMLLIGFLFVVTFYNIPKMLPDENKAGFKKGYASLETAIATLLANTDIYNENLGFQDTTKITFEGTGIVLGKNEETTKFRDSIKYSLPVVKDNIRCQLTGGGSFNKCFKTHDGVVFGIPDTDFEKINTTKYKSAVNQDKEITVVQIAFYPSWRDTYTFKENGFLINIEANGGINFENNTKEKTDKIREYMTSTTIKVKSIDEK